MDIYSGMNSSEDFIMFRTSSWMKRFGAILSSTVIGLMVATGVDAANPETVVVEVTFVAAITIVEDNALQFGLLDEALNLEVITIATDDGLTDLGGMVIGGLQRAADLTITATTGVSMNIAIVGTANTGYTLATFLCDYQLGTITACDGGGYTVTSVATGALRVGVTLTGDNSAVPGVSNGSFTVTVSYI